MISVSASLPVQRGTALAALLGRGAAEVAQHRGEPAAAAEGGDAHGVPGAQILSGGERCLGLGPQGGKVVGHGWRYISSFQRKREPRPRSIEDAHLGPRFRGDDVRARLAPS
jgi:hypothetical protein